MSESPAVHNQEGAEPTPNPPESPEQGMARPKPRKTMSGRVVRELLHKRSAAIGFVWVLVLLLGAVFAPFIANSHPLAVKQGGEWSFPLFRHLTPMDVTLLVAFFAFLIAIPLNVCRMRWRFLAALGVTVLALVLSFIFVKPPEAIVYEQYREDGASIESIWRVPVPYSPADRLRDQPDLRLSAPSWEHPMGVTSNGADLFANMLYATRIALSIGFISTGIAITIGIVIGGLMGYFSGIIDLLGMRLVEIFSAVPTLFLLLALVAAIPPEWQPYMLYAIMVIIGLTSWVGYAVFIRAEFLKLRKQEFVQAAQALGLPLWSILFKHMLPNGVAPVLVSASFGVAGAILAESTLSFLGIGLVAEASWGKLLNQALGVGGTFYWWIAVYPGLAIFLTVFAYNLVGEALRDAIDPRLQGNS